MPVFWYQSKDLETFELLSNEFQGKKWHWDAKPTKS